MCTAQSAEWLSGRGLGENFDTFLEYELKKTKAHDFYTNILLATLKNCRLSALLAVPKLFLNLIVVLSFGEKSEFLTYSREPRFTRS